MQFSAGTVVNVRAGFKGVKKKTALSQWFAKGVIVHVSGAGNNYYKLKWLTTGLSKEPIGTLSNTAFHAARLRYV